MALGVRGDLFLIFFWTLFFVRIYQNESLTLWPVDSCPKNQSEVEAATLRLNCSDVRESINVYHCLPISNLSGLIEFCYDGRSGLVEAGNCMVLYRDTLNNYPCGHFNNGCPNAYYFPKNMYNYPACLKINTQNSCYIADPSCPSVRSSETTTMTTFTSTGKETNMLTYTANDDKNLPFEATSIPALSGYDNHRLLYIIPVSLGILLPLVSIALVILLNWRIKRARKGLDNHNVPEAFPLMEEVNSMNESLDNHNVPEAFPLMSEEDDSMNEISSYLEDKDFLERYQKYLKEGSVEVCPISQIIIVGEHGVGKTTLLYRLQGRSRKEIKAMKSTRGVECHTEHHSFIITKEKNQLEMNRKGVSSFSVDPGYISGFSKDNDRQKENDKEPNHDQQTEYDQEPKHDEQIDYNEEPKNHQQIDGKKETKDAQQTVRDKESRDYKPDNIEVEHDEEAIHDQQTECDEEPKDDRQTSDQVPKNDQQTIEDGEPKHDELTEHDTEQNQTECNAQSLIEMLEEDLEKSMNVKSRFGNKDDVVLDVLDFAGQGEYYASHQTYIRKNAIFILVVDTSKDVNKRKEIQEREENKSIPGKINKNQFLCDRPGVAFRCWSPKDYFYYWLKTIQIHGGSNERIIFVGTRKDQKRTDFNFVHLLNDAITENLVTKEYLKPVLTDLGRYDEVTEKSLTEIKSKICHLVSKCEKEIRPAQWVKISNRFDIIKRKYPFIKIEDALGIIDHSDFKMSDTEIADMLHFFHASGKIIFFNIERLREILILDIPWFIDCFKHIIADREHVEEDCQIVEVKDQKMLNNFHDKGVLEIGLYKKLLTQKGISEQDQIILGEYQSKLGMMFYFRNYKIDDDCSIDGWYVPSINTQEFKPSNARYISIESSQILCFKFKDYLPYDFFGRLIVACVNSGHWRPYDFRLYKAGADMCYSKSGDEGEEIYLFSSKRIITVQFIGKHSDKNGQEVKQDIQNIVRQVVQFYAHSTEYEFGFICRKEEGYKENSMNHFVSKRSKFCVECHERCDWVDTEPFWKEVNNKETTILKSKQMDPVKISHNVYYHVVKQATEIEVNTRTAEGTSSKIDSTWLDILVDVGQKLNDLQRESEAKDETNQTALRSINIDLKMVSRELDKHCRDLRKEIFFMLTETKDFREKKSGIPSVSMKNSSPTKLGAKLVLEVKSEVTILHHVWFRKLTSERKYQVLYHSEEAKDKFEFQKNENKVVLAIKNFDLKEEGSYFVVIETETGVTVRREIVKSSAVQEQTKQLHHKLTEALTKTHEQVAVSEGMSFVEYQSNMVSLAKKITMTTQEMVGIANVNPSGLGRLANQLTLDYDILASNTAKAAATASSQDIANRIRTTVQDLGKRCVDLVQDAVKVQDDLHKTLAHADLQDHAQSVSEKVSFVLAALQSESPGTQAYINAANAVSGIIADLDTTIMFATAGTLISEDDDTFANHREDILKTSKAMVEETKKLVEGASSDQETLAGAAQAVKTITKLADVVKLGAISLGSDQPEAQVMIINAMKDVASAYLDLISATKNAFRKNTSDLTLLTLKKSAKVMVTNVTSLLKAVKTVEEEAARGTRALESTIDAIGQEIKSYEAGALPEKKSTAEDLIRLTKPIITATAKAVAAGNSARQEDVIICANMGRKSIFDLLATCRGTASTAETTEVRQKTIEAGKSCALVYKDLLKQVRVVVNKHSQESRETLAALSRQVATSVQEVVHCAELIKGEGWVDPEDPTVIAESELLTAAKSIEAAAQKFSQLKPRKKAKEHDMSLNFEEQILEAAKSIASATAALVKSASAAQRELVAQGKVRTRREIGATYHKSQIQDDDGQWSEGLISAAKLVAAATHSLCESSNAMVQGHATEERLIASAKEVAGSTAHLLVACRTKADPNSVPMKRLQAAGNAVKRATEIMVRAAQQAKHIDEDKDIDVAVDSRKVGGIKQELQFQQEMLRKEREWMEAREKLAKFRKQRYKDAPQDSDSSSAF